MAQDHPPLPEITRFVFGDIYIQHQTGLGDVIGYTHRLDTPSPDFLSRCWSRACYASNVSLVEHIAHSHSEAYSQAVRAIGYRRALLYTLPPRPHVPLENPPSPEQAAALVDYIKPLELSSVQNHWEDLRHAFVAAGACPGSRVSQARWEEAPRELSYEDMTRPPPPGDLYTAWTTGEGRVGTEGESLIALMMLHQADESGRLKRMKIFPVSMDRAVEAARSYAAIPALAFPDQDYAKHLTDVEEWFLSFAAFICEEHDAGTVALVYRDVPGAMALIDELKHRVEDRIRDQMQLQRPAERPAFAWVGWDQDITGEGPPGPDYTDLMEEHRRRAAGNLQI
jgi:hypothetical protein